MHQLHAPPGAHIAGVEHGIGTHLDVVGTGCGIGDDTVGLEHANGPFSLAEHVVQPVLEDLHRLLGGEILWLILEVTTAIDVVQVVRQHQAKVGQGRVTGVESIRGGAVQLLGDQAEVLGTARFKHAHHHAVFAAHALHDLPDRVELAQLANDVALDALELGLDRAGVERQRTRLVVGTINRRRLLALGLEKALADVVVPLHRVQDPDSVCAATMRSDRARMVCWYSSTGDSFLVHETCTGLFAGKPAPTGISRSPGLARPL